MGRPLFGSRGQGESPAGTNMEHSQMTEQAVARQENNHPISCLCADCSSTSSNSTPLHSSPLASTSTTAPPLGNASDIPTPEGASPSLLESFVRTRDSLRRVSEALDNTYDILRNLRDSLESLSDQMGARRPFNLPSIEENTIGPSHSAILLSPSHEHDESQRLPIAASPSNTSSNTAPGPVFLESINESSRAVLQLAEGRDGPPSSARTTPAMSRARSQDVVRTARAMLDIFNRERRGLHDPEDGTTLRGRRVAVRELVGRMDAENNESGRTSGSSSDESGDDQPRAIRVSGAGPNATPLDFRPPPQFILRRETPSASSLPGPVSSVPQELPPPPRRLDYESRLAAVRAYMLAQHNSRATSAPADTPHPASSAARGPTGDPSESRSYRVRRRLNADGQEPVHYIDATNMTEDPVDWLDGHRSESPPPPLPPQRRPDPSWSPWRHPLRESPAVERAMGARRTTASLVPVGAGQPGSWCQYIECPFRRYFNPTSDLARLDPDGNIVPIEDIRSARDTILRIRSNAADPLQSSMQRVQDGSQPASSALAESDSERFDYVWYGRLSQTSARRASRSPATSFGRRDSRSPPMRVLDLDEAINVSDPTSPPIARRAPRMSTGRHAPRRPHGERQSSVERAITFGSSVPFEVNPLPVALEEIIPSYDRQSEGKRPATVARGKGGRDFWLQR